MLSRTENMAEGARRAPAMVAPLLLVAAGIGLAAAHLSGATLPLIGSDRDMFLALIVVGWLGCSIAVGPAAAALGWSHPRVLAAAGLGVIALAVIGAVLLGFVADRDGIVALGTVLVAKAGLGLVTALA